MRIRRFGRAGGAALLLAALFAGCSGETSTSTEQTTSARPAPAPVEGEALGTVIGRVGGQPIGSAALDAAGSRVVPANGKALSEEEKKKVLEQVVMDELLYREAFAQALYRDPKVRKIMVNLLLREEIYAGVHNGDFSQEEMEAFYEAHKEEFVIPEKIQIKRIFIKTGSTRTDEEARAIADEAHARVTAKPDSFQDVAAEISEDPYKRRGGDIGYVSHEGKPGVEQEVIDRAFDMAVGQISQVFRTPGGYNIVQVAAKRDRMERSFEQMKGSVLRRLKNDRYETLTNDFVERLKKEFPVELDEAAIAGVTVHGNVRPLGAMGERGSEDALDDPDRLQRLLEGRDEDDGFPGGGEDDEEE